MYVKRYPYIFKNKAFNKKLTWSLHWGPSSVYGLQSLIKTLAPKCWHTLCDPLVGVDCENLTLTFETSHVYYGLCCSGVWPCEVSYVDSSASGNILAIFTFEEGEGMFLRNVAIYLQVYTVSQPRRTSPAWTLVSKYLYRVKLQYDDCMKKKTCVLFEYLLPYIFVLPCIKWH
jgi:hypothetical protein